MINFIICDDIKEDLEVVLDVVSCYMMQNKIEYKTHVFRDYNDDFLKIIETKMPYKIYILDIETPNRSGIDVARIIRKKDVDSVLIFLTGHQELSDLVVKNEFSFLTFINKFDNRENHLKRALDKAIQTIKVRKSLKFKDGGIIYKIPLDDILYITRDSIDRKSIIVTDYQEFKVSKTLTEISGMLNGNFIQTHRACFVNKKRVVSFNKHQKIITFDNGTSTDLISARFDKELI